MLNLIYAKVVDVKLNFFAIVYFFIDFSLVGVVYLMASK